MLKKAAGHRLHDAKSMHVTIKETGKPRETLTMGFYANTTHTGEDSAIQVTNVLKMLSILSESPLSEVKQAIDFWIVDRAGDAKPMLENLEIDDSKIIKCNAHIILCVDHAIEKVFIDAENKIGAHKLLDISVGTKKITGSGSSIFTLSQIAIAKLLSPSHAEQSISHYTQFQEWCAKNELPIKGFKGFVGNRFGRIAHNAKVFLDLHDNISKYFSEVVDETSNKLLTAISHYITNDWVKLCTEVYVFIAEIIIFPLMNILGIDQHKKRSKANSSNWEDVYNFFKTKLSDISKLENEYSELKDGKNKFIHEILKEVNESIERQLSEVKVFEPLLKSCPMTQKETAKQKKTLDTLRNAPLTNSGCESENAYLGLMCSQTGGSASLQTLNKKRVISKNKFLMNEATTNATDEQRQAMWKWSRTSEAAKSVKEIERAIVKDVCAAKELSLEVKKLNKFKKKSRILKLLDVLKQHDGPCTPSNIDSLLPKLDDKQLIQEISYLRATVNPDIRQKQRVKQVFFTLCNF